MTAENNETTEPKTAPWGLLWAIPMIIPKLLGVGFLAGIGVAFAADMTPSGPIDYVNEIWKMAISAGVLGTVVLGISLNREVKRGDKDRAELRRMQEERDAMHERSLTALIGLDQTLKDHARIMAELVASNRALVDWVRERAYDRKG